MLRALASFLFYARFLRQFSTIGLRARAKHFDTARFDFRGQRWIVTGASGGIGSAIAQGAHAAGAHVIAVARSLEKLNAIRATQRDPERFECLSVDFSELAQVQQFADSQPAESVDVLVNNVGVLRNQFEINSDGIERSLASNLLSHVLLTDTLAADGAFRSRAAVVNMSSGGMYGMPLAVRDLIRDAKQFDGMAAYALHKRAQVEMTQFWQSDWAQLPERLVYAMHPGWVDTDGVKQSLPWFRAVLQRFLRTSEQAADTALWLAHARPKMRAAIWLDRNPDPLHAFAFTQKSPDTPTQLATVLRTMLAEIAPKAR